MALKMVGFSSLTCRKPDFLKGLSRLFHQNAVKRHLEIVSLFLIWLHQKAHNLPFLQLNAKIRNKTQHLANRCNKSK